MISLYRGARLRHERSAEGKRKRKEQVRKGFINHREALRVLLSSMAADRLPKNVRAELPAIISHWLQTPGSKPLLIDKKYAAVWRARLSAYAHSAKPTAFLNKSNCKRLPKFTIDFSSLAFPPPTKPKFLFVDLFAGIGGFRIALQKLGGKCLFSSEWNRDSKETYYENFGEVPFGDLRQFTNSRVTDRQISETIPDHHVLAAGFPCQPFSKAGVSARNALGQQHGFLCRLQGTLFFDLLRVAKAKRPRVLFLENVGDLQTHDSGKTFAVMRDLVEGVELRYSFSSSVIDASSLVPQRRRRCYIVCLRDNRNRFTFPTVSGKRRALASILQQNVNSRYTISDRLWRGHVRRSKRNMARGTGFIAFEADLTKPARTLVARYYKDGKECLIPQPDKNPRRLTPRECARLQGYPEEFVVHRIDTPAYRQFGNAVVVPVVLKIGRRIADRVKSKHV